ncbi:MAG: hypothetical protein KatS3mg050_2735 [Litorilinea sp.]|nr:MAG: hypothetical protein KatS3mg050_2735 [Litorilinea sp.]
MGRADVRSIQALADLRSTLLRFGAETEAALRAMDAQVRQTLKYLSERQRYWEVQVSAAEEEYKRARAALQACQSRRHIDSRTGRSYAPPCTQENQRVLRASLARAKAQDQLRQVLNWRRLVENSAKEYQREAGRMADWLRQELPKASGLLENKVNTLYDYTSSRPSTGTWEPLQEDIPLKEALETIPDHGIREIPLGQIDWEEMGGLAQDDYHKVSAEEMREGLRKMVEVVRPAVQQGATAEDFSHMDEERGLDYPHGYRRIYDAFYGPHECIVVEKVGDRYQVLNGRHRLWLAREMGMKSLPARVLGLPGGMLEEDE